MQRTFINRQLLPCLVLAISLWQTACSTEIGNPEIGPADYQYKTPLSIIGFNSQPNCSESACDEIPVIFPLGMGSYKPIASVIRLNEINSQNQTLAPSAKEFTISAIPSVMELASQKSIAGDLRIMLSGDSSAPIAGASCADIPAAHTCLHGALQFNYMDSQINNIEILFAFVKTATLQWNIEYTSVTETSGLTLSFDMSKWFSFSSDIFLKEIQPTAEEISKGKIIITENRAPRTMKAIWDNLQNNSSTQKGNKPAGLPLKKSSP